MVFLYGNSCHWEMKKQEAPGSLVSNEGSTYTTQLCED